MRQDRLAEIRTYLDEIYAPGRLGDLYAIELLDHVDQLTAQLADARRLALPAFTSPEGDLSEHTHVLDGQDAERCKHCGLLIIYGTIQSPTGWVHAEGPQEFRHRCALDDYGYDAAPATEECSASCLGAEWRSIPERPSAYDMPVGSVVVTSQETYTRCFADDNGGWARWTTESGELTKPATIQSGWIEGLFSDGLVTEWRVP
jgi:hypothetical protein